MMRLNPNSPPKSSLLPHWFNHLGEWLESGEGLLYKDPQRLHWRSVAGSGLSVEVFSSILKQWPSLKQLLLDLPDDPLKDPALSEVLQLWLPMRTAEALRHTHVRSSGLALLQGKNPLQAFAPEALPQRLTFVLPSHKPSLYAMYSGRAAQELPELLEGLYQLLTWRKHQGLTQEDLFIDLCFWLEPLQLSHISEMLRLAENLGVDGVCFELLPSYSPKASVVSQPLEPQQMVQAFQQQGLHAQKLRLPIALPPMKGFVAEKPVCPAVSTTLAVWSEQVRVQGCAHMEPNPQGEEPLWEGDAWNSQGPKQWRRFWEVYAQQQERRGVAAAPELQQLPKACQVCPMQPNSQAGPVLNSQWLPLRYQTSYSTY